jgi:hypothetical protein
VAGDSCQLLSRGTGSSTFSAHDLKGGGGERALKGQKYLTENSHKTLVNGMKGEPFAPKAPGALPSLEGLRTIEARIAIPDRASRETRNVRVGSIEKKVTPDYRGEKSGVRISLRDFALFCDSIEGSVP